MKRRFRTGTATGKREAHGQAQRNRWIIRFAEVRAENEREERKVCLDGRSGVRRQTRRKQHVTDTIERKTVKINRLFDGAQNKERNVIRSNHLKCGHRSFANECETMCLAVSASDSGYARNRVHRDKKRTRNWIWSAKRWQMKRMQKRTRGRVEDKNMLRMISVLSNVV